MIRGCFLGLPALAQHARYIAYVADRPRPGPLMIRCALVAGLLAPLFLAAQDAVTTLDSASRALAAVAERQRVFLASAPGATSARNLATTLRLMAQFRSSSSAYGTWTPLRMVPGIYPTEITADYFDRRAASLMDQATRYIHLKHFAKADAVFSALCHHCMRLTMRVDPPQEAIDRHRDLVVRLEASLRSFVVSHADSIGIGGDVARSKLERWKSGGFSTFFIKHYVTRPSNILAEDFNYLSAIRITAMAAWSTREWKLYVDNVPQHFKHRHVTLYHAAIEEGALREDMAGFSGTPWYPMGIGEFMDTLWRWRLPEALKMLEEQGDIDPLGK